MEIPAGNSSDQEASEAELRLWVETCFGVKIRGWQQISGGNRCRSWVISLESGTALPSEVYLRYQPPREPSAEPYTVWREALVYSALLETGVRAPRLLFVHRSHQAIITTAAMGRADFRRLSDDVQKGKIVQDFVCALAELHAQPFSKLSTGSLSAPETIEDCVREEIRIWQAMYDETGRRDPLVELALNWLTSNLPAPDETPVLVHGDAGPGNFLFQGEHMTGLIDWELAHPGDPIEDLAWFCMRSVMEPVPDFPGALAAYEAASGRIIDLKRLLYHRVFVSLRVVIIRHRNVTGLPGNSIVSRSLNRRLLVDALAAAQAVDLPERDVIPEGETDRTAYFDGVIADLQSLSDAHPVEVSSFAKNTAKVIKYLRQYDSIGREIEARQASQIEQLLGRAYPDPIEARDALASKVSDGTIPFEQVLRTFSLLVGYEAQLAAPSSGRMADRGFPPITKEA